ncbi:MAG: branched-chain amino acid ABC transporter permease [Anaerolineaceae bacterium]
MDALTQHILIIIGINVISALGLHIITGLTGQFSLAHATFAGIGAYTSALLTLNSNVPFPVALLAGVVLAGIASALVGYPSLRLRGDYLAIATLGFGEVFRVSMLNFKFTNGALGLHGILQMTNLYWVAGGVAICIFLTYMMTKSRTGRILTAIREDELIAESFGVNLGKYKVFAFVMGGCFAGLAGGFYAHYLLFVNPTDFGVMKSVDILLYIIIGGLGTIPGVLVGTALLTGLPELLRPFAQYRMLAYGIGLVLIMVYRPSGLLGSVDSGSVLYKAYQRIRKTLKIPTVKNE